MMVFDLTFITYEFFRLVVSKNGLLGGIVLGWFDRCILFSQKKSFERITDSIRNNILLYTSI